MNWAPFIIPLIVLIVWILSNLVRQEEPPKRGNRPRRPVPGGDPQQRPRPQRSADDVDRFLENLRKQRQGEQALPPPRKPKPIPPPVPAKTTTPTRTPTPTPTLEQQTIPVLVPQTEPDPITMDFAQYASPPQPVLPVTPLRPPYRSTRTTNRSAAAEKLFKMDLLRDREMLQAAFLLREVFARPLSQRPGRTPMDRR